MHSKADGKVSLVYSEPKTERNNEEN